MAESRLRPFVESNCVSCHDESTKSGELDLEKLVSADVSEHAADWEKVVRKLSAREMPPKDAERPDESEYKAVVAGLSTTLDEAASRHLNPGRTDSFRRLNRTEYQNAIRDLLDLEVDTKVLLPPDESSLGFDNVTVTDLPPALLNRYVSAAQKISRLAVGSVSRTPQADHFRMRPDVTQDVHIEGLPLGTRGGMLIPYNFAQDGDYEIQIRLMRNRDEKVEGLNGKHKLAVLLDREEIASFTVKPPERGETEESIDAKLLARVHVTAGPHKVGRDLCEEVGVAARRQCDNRLTCISIRIGIRGWGRPCTKFRSWGRSTRRGRGTRLAVGGFLSPGHQAPRTRKIVPAASF